MLVTTHLLAPCKSSISSCTNYKYLITDAKTNTKTHKYDSKYTGGAGAGDNVDDATHFKQTMLASAVSCHF